ncbi:MAG: hypothetical protein U0168_11835 [Nannocystaceae bacterium]
MPSADRPQALRAALIAGYRRVHAAPADRADRVLARLRRPGDELAVVGVRPAAPRLLPMVAIAVAAAVLAVIALQAITGTLARRSSMRSLDEAVDRANAGVHGGVASPRSGAPQDAATTRRAAPVVAVPAELPAVPVQRPSSMASPPIPIQAPAAVPAVRPQRASPPPAPAPGPAPPGPADDTALLVQARKLIDRGAWSEAAAVLLRHAEAFPHSPRAHARDAFRVVVECRREPGANSRAAARDFLLQHAGSPHVQQILAACRGPSPAPIDPLADAPAAPAPAAGG